MYLACLTVGHYRDRFRWQECHGIGADVSSAALGHGRSGKVPVIDSKLFEGRIISSVRVRHHQYFLPYIRSGVSKKSVTMDRALQRKQNREVILDPMR